MNNYLVFYESRRGIKGNVDCEFLHNPPHIDDIRNLEKDISKRYCNDDKAIVTGWMKIQDKEDYQKPMHGDYLQLTINDVSFKVNDIIDVVEKSNTSIHTKYRVEFGYYESDNQKHVGWYLIDEITSEHRPIGYLIDNTDILNFSLVSNTDNLK